jgi:Family of unknown function (DUF6932)
VDALPRFTETGDLPPGIHRAPLTATLLRFGQGSAQRRLVGERLRRLHELAQSTGHVSRFVVVGSFVTGTLAPNDVDPFLIMDDAFEASAVRGEAAPLFDHAAAQAYFGASVFWVRRPAALGGEDAAIAHWQIKRDGGRRGIVEVVPDDQG